MPYIEKEKVDEKTRLKLEAIIEKSYSTFWKQKRLFDIFFATLILLFFLPLMIIIAIIIVIDDPSAGPFYKQIRVGRHGKEFYMYKFRTMRANADKMFEEATYEEQDMLVLPGGMPGTLHLKEHKGLEELLRKFYQKEKFKRRFAVSSERRHIKTIVNHGNLGV